MIITIQSCCDVLSSHLYLVRQRLKVVSPLGTQSKTGAAEEGGGKRGKGMELDVERCKIGRIKK